MATRRDLWVMHSLSREGGEFISEGHPFDYAQGRPSDSRPFGFAQDGRRGFAPLHTPYFISLLVEALPAGPIVYWK